LLPLFYAVTYVVVIIIFFRYYDGVVNAYDHVKGKHKLLYDDGYVEQLNLKKHRWELVDANVLPDEVSKNLYIIHSDTDTIRKLAGAYDM
jgi:hypothetical protein